MRGPRCRVRIRGGATWVRGGVVSAGGRDVRQRVPAGGGRAGGVPRPRHPRGWRGGGRWGPGGGRRGGSGQWGGAVTGNKRTVLPSLGKGTAGSGSGGATLVTGRSKTIPAYFVGHWVEIRNAAGILEGTWRIGSIGVDGKTVTLLSNGGEAITVDE